MLGPGSWSWWGTSVQCHSCSCMASRPPHSGQKNFSHFRQWYHSSMRPISCHFPRHIPCQHFTSFGTARVGSGANLCFEPRQAAILSCRSFLANIFEVLDVLTLPFLFFASSVRFLASFASAAARTCSFFSVSQSA